MTEAELKEYVASGREIEFHYKGKNYSITYFGENMEISFCEYDKEPIDVQTFDELIKIKYDGVKLVDMLASLTENDIWIF